MLPVVALVGRPNVGKSTLFNRLTGSRDAIVANYSGLTRDRKYGEAKIDGRRFMVIDTGGLSASEETDIDREMAAQSFQAVQEADVVLFIVDGRAGMMPDDAWVIDKLRTAGKPFMMVVNKVDGVNIDVALADFYSVGAESLYPITATQGRGVGNLMEDVLDRLPPPPEEDDANASKGTKIGIVGRPNVGKSTLVNRMLGEERVVVFDMPGTTRDSIYIDYERHEKPYTLIDTAGVRRKKNVRETVEKFSIVKTLQAIDDANVVVLVVDAQEDLVDQDLHLLGLCIQAGRGLVLAVNKWDGLDQDQKKRIKSEIDRRLNFIDYAEVHFISALHGSGVGKLYESVDRAHESATKKLQTKRLTEILEVACEQHQPPLVGGRRIKLRYAHAGGSNPPIIVIHGNQTDKLPDHYKRYLEKTFRRELGLWGTPIRMEFRTSENPFEHKPNKRSKKEVFRREKAQKRGRRGNNKQSPR
ncbi:GTPase Der [BD1-7 clade bacterium]|uniref:GTPase Der n=1 Tax=BD1-7 clade bacterium TaxID=2029982 RepID=A0A5S9N2W6_9GAMM|nr:GTPase Der [BD1-7 clade bacterium]